MSWSSWRIHIIQPEQKCYRLCGSTSDVDQWNRDFPEPEFTIDMPQAREAWLHASIYAKDPATTGLLELIGYDEQVQNDLGNFELMICHRDDEEWGPGIISRIASYTLEGKLDPGDTMDIAPAVPEDSLIAAFLLL